MGESLTEKEFRTNIVKTFDLKGVPVFTKILILDILDYIYYKYIVIKP